MHTRFCLMTIIFQIILCHVIRTTCYELNHSQISENVSSSRILSRRKRFLIFPDGSSLQLVFCCQTPALISIGDIFLYGNTAALAWNLPSDPDLLLKLKKYEKNALRRQDTKHIYYVGEKGQLVAKVPYTRQNIINPAFAKRSVSEPTLLRKGRTKPNRKLMHKIQLKRDYLKLDHFDESTVKFHRSNRFEIFDKLEKLYQGLGHDGHQCILRQLCESRKTPHKQGSFLQEILQTLFTLPKGTNYDKVHHKAYDAAREANEDCVQLYPDCPEFNVPFQ